MTDIQIAQNILRAIQLKNPSILRIDTLVWICNLYRGYAGTLPDLGHRYYNTPAARKEWRTFLSGNSLRDIIVGNYPMLSWLTSINNWYRMRGNNHKETIESLHNWKACVGVLYYVRVRLPLFSYRFKFTVHNPWENKTTKGWHDEISDSPRNAFIQFCRDRQIGSINNRYQYKFHSVKTFAYNWRIEIVNPSVLHPDVLAVITAP